MRMLTYIDMVYLYIVYLCHSSKHQIIRVRARELCCTIEMDKKDEWRGHGLYIHLQNKRRRPTREQQLVCSIHFSCKWTYD